MKRDLESSVFNDADSVNTSEELVLMDKYNSDPLDFLEESNSFTPAMFSNDNIVTPERTSSEKLTATNLSKPKRPLTAYNLFFRSERLKILAAQHEGSDLEGNLRDKTSRRKTHGKVGFMDLARKIGKRWRNLDPQKRAHFEGQAAEDIKRYRKDMEKYRQTLHVLGGRSYHASPKSANQGEFCMDLPHFDDHRATFSIEKETCDLSRSDLFIDNYLGECEVPISAPGVPLSMSSNAKSLLSNDDDNFLQQIMDGSVLNNNEYVEEALSDENPVGLRELDLMTPPRRVLSPKDSSTHSLKKRRTSHYSSHEDESLANLAYELVCENLPRSRSPNLSPVSTQREEKLRSRGKTYAAPSATSVTELAESMGRSQHSRELLRQLNTNTKKDLSYRKYMFESSQSREQVLKYFRSF